MNQSIYVYSTESLKYPKTLHTPSGDIYYKPWYKIGMTTQETVDDRIIQQDRTANPEKLEKQYELDLKKSGINMSAYELEQKIHSLLTRAGKHIRKEWFELEGGIPELKSLIELIIDNTDVHKKELSLKPHQENALLKIEKCFNTEHKKCLLNHKPRSGKTYITLTHIKNNQYKLVAILTSYPILNYQWEDMIENHKGFLNYNIINVSGSKVDKIELDKNKNNIILLSLQDVKGGEEVFEKEKFDLIRDMNVDLLVIDEIHFGFETDKTHKFLDKLNYKRLLGLSATPTKNLLCGTFSKEQIDSYTLIDEGKLKIKYPDLYPYANMNWLIWNLTEEERSLLKSYSDEEQLTMKKLFRIENNEFYYKNDIIYLLKKLIGDRSVCGKDKLGISYPFKNNRMFNNVKSILLFVSDIQTQCKLVELLNGIDSYVEEFNIHFTNSKEYSSSKLIRAIKRDFKSGDKRSLIVAVDQLTTGITLEDCDMVCFMNDWQSLDKYIQASFRCQTPRIGKLDSFVLDLNPSRSFEMIYEYNNILSRFGKNSMENTLKEWFECVNVFNRVDGGFEKIDVDEFNQKYIRILSERPRFNYNIVIYNDKLELVRDQLINIGITAGKSSDKEKINEDGIEKGKNTVKKKLEGEKKEVSVVKLMEIAKALVDKTMLLSIFTYYKHDKIDECFEALENDDTIVEGIGELERDMFLDTLLVGIKDVKNVKLSDIKLIYNTIFDKEIINKKLFIFNQKVYKIKELIKNGEYRMLKNYLELMDSYLKPSTTEKKYFGEVFTPFKLIEEMLDTLPVEVWSNPDLKWLDPCNGVGNFPAVVVMRLMEGLKEWEPDEEKRYKHIIENMIYVCDISPKNMFIYLMIFDPDEKYNMNFHRGSFLDDGFDEKMKEWGLTGFDIVMGNPPYQDPNNKRLPLWNKFIFKSEKITMEYLLLVTPSSWRKPDHIILNLFKKSNLLYVKIFSHKDGIDIFNVGTRMDIFLLKKDQKYVTTRIIDESNNEYNLSIRNRSYIPNNNILFIDTITDSKDKLNIIHSRSDYGNDKKHMNREKTNKYIYPCVYSTPSKKPINLLYSSIKNGHFGIKKVILGKASPENCIYDKNGDYGVTNNCIGIVVSNDKEADNIISAIKSDRFKDLIKDVKWSGFSIEPEFFESLNKNFWKEFI